MMQLVIEDDGNLQVVNLDKDELEITIGRREGSNIKLGERNVSRQHAILSKSQNQVFIEDFSRYGTRVNGRRLEEAERVEIKHGDELGIGDFRILLEDDEVDEATAAAAAQTQSQDIPQREQPKLVAISSNFAGKEFEIKKNEVVIGRTSDNDIVIDNHSISRNHAKITRTDKTSFLIQDLDSANGIKIKGRPVKEFQLNSGDIVELGQVKFRFCEAGENWFFDPERFPIQDAAPKLPPPPPPKSNALIFAIAGVVVVGIIAVVIIATRPSDKGDASTSQNTSGPTTQTEVSDDDKIRVAINGIEGEISITELDSAFTGLKNLTLNYPPEKYPTVKRMAPDLASRITDAHLAAALTAPSVAGATERLTKAASANSFALGIDATLDAAKAHSTQIKSEQDYLPKIAEAEKLLQDALAKSPPDRVGCKDAAEKLSMITNASLSIQIAKSFAAKSTLPASAAACVEASYTSEIDALLAAKSTSKAKDLLDSYAADVPNASSKIPSYRRRINDIENPPDTTKPDTTKPDTTKVEPPPSGGSAAEAERLAEEADGIKLSNPAQAIKLYKQSLKIKNSSGVRGRMAAVMEIVGLDCDAAKEYDKIGNAAKASAARSKGGCP
jgi:pSer/pThr/pTyr-binding forkhead associated (FHA) protein